MNDIEPISRARGTRGGRRRHAPAAPESTAGRAFVIARWALCAAAVGYGALRRVHYFDACIHDDAFISFRYARNLVRGAGLVMNPDERVEGFTNFLWTVLAAPVLAAGGDPAWWAQVVGATLAVGLVAAAFVFSERRLGGGAYALVAPAFLTFNLAYVMESLSGLETLFFAALVFGAYVAFLEERRDVARRPGAWAVWCALATLVRPEGMLVFGLLAAYATLGVWRGEPAARLRQAAILYGVLVLPLFAWRLAYYGSPLPNTFYTKVGYTTAQVARGWMNMYHTVGWTLTAPLLLVAAMLSVVALLRPLPARGVPPPAAPWTRLLSGRPRDEAIAVALVLWLGDFTYIMLVGGDYEPTARFYTPVLVLLYLLFQEGLRTFALLFATTGPVFRAGITAATLAGGAACLAQTEHRIALVLQARRWPEGRQRHHRNLSTVGMWLRDHTPPSTLVAVSSIGAMSYYADRPIVDMMGLTDRHIGRRRMPDMGRGPAGHEKGDGAYVLSRRPDIILLDKGHFFPKPASPGDVLAGAGGISELEIVRSAEFQRDYVLRSTTVTGGYFYFFERKK